MKSRAAWIMWQIGKCWPKDAVTRFYLAGGALAGDVNDVDLFPVACEKIVHPNGTVICESKNATTIKCDPWPVQVCKYQRESLQALVESFDFAHIQVGAMISLKQGTAVVDYVYCTQAFLDARAIGSTWFTGSGYPLSSMVRLGKYFKRGSLGKSAYIRSVIDTLVAVVMRGFDGYADFKDQLDAVDLGLVPEELDEVSKSSLKELFELLNRERK